MNTCDVIIPTYNNRPVLAATLAALFAQGVPGGWGIRVIVSDDGSTDDTLAWLDSLASLDLPLSPSWPLTIVSGPHTGPAGARNRALAVSRADIIFFLGSDILLRPQVLAKHLDFHTRHPNPLAAALGAVKWDPRLTPSPFMEWVAHGGQQNAFDELLGETTADPRHYFYGSHLSLKRLALGSQVFTPSLIGGWEDLDLGRRLTRQGLQLYVLPSAISLHHHQYSVPAFAHKQCVAGQQLVSYQALHRASPLIPQRSLFQHIRRWLFCLCGGQALLGFVLRLLGTRYSLPRLFMVYTATQFWRGVWRSQGGLLAFISQFYKFSATKG